MLKGPLIFPRKLVSTSERKVAIGSNPCFAHLILREKKRQVRIFVRNDTDIDHIEDR